MKRTRRSDHGANTLAVRDDADDIYDIDCMFFWLNMHHDDDDDEDEDEDGEDDDDVDTYILFVHVLDA